ncbi:MAG: AraC family transcriptional regulator [Bacteroidales bacterium]|nr:AraC family transcriptional regulator [Bacteroidales bacterium]
MTFKRYYEQFDVYSTLFPIQAFAVLASFPLFYLYILNVTSAKDLLLRNVAPHFALPIIWGISLFILMYNSMNSHERFLFISEHVYTESIDILKFKIGYFLYRGGKYVYIFQSAVYLYLIIKLYKENNIKTNEIFSNSEGVNLAWLRYIGLAFIFVFIFNLIMHGLKLNYISTHHYLVIVSYIVFSSFFMLLGLLSIKQKNIYNQIAINYEDKKEEQNGKELNIHLINKYLNDQKPYLNPEYNIYNMCSEFNINRTYISNIINRDYGINFKTLINSHRIDDAKQMIALIHRQKKSIVLNKIAKDVGFNSYATFLRVFKQIEGVSPSEYIDNL